MHIVAYKSDFLQHSESQTSLAGTKTQVELTESFEQLRSHPFEPSWVEMQQEAKRLGISPRAYKQQFQAWMRGGAA